MFENNTFHFSVMNAATAGWARKARTRQRDSQKAVLAVAVAMVLGLGGCCGGRREEGGFTLLLF